jgi:hypothetical protein
MSASWHYGRGRGDGYEGPFGPAIRQGRTGGTTRGIVTPRGVAAPRGVDDALPLTSNRAA